MRDIRELKALFPLRGKNVELRLFSQSDISDRYVSWLSDPDIVRYSNQRFKEHSLESCQQYLKSFTDAPALFVAIYPLNKEQMIGTMTVYFNPHHQTADIGIMVGEKEQWGTGIGRDSWQRLLSFLSHEAKLRKITGGTLACNKGMVSIMQSSNMTPDGIRHQQELVDGEAYDMLHFAFFPSQS